MVSLHSINEMSLLLVSVFFLWGVLSSLFIHGSFQLSRCVGSGAVLLTLSCVSSPFWRKPFGGMKWTSSAFSPVSSFRMLRTCPTRCFSCPSSALLSNSSSGYRAGANRLLQRFQAQRSLLLAMPRNPLLMPLIQISTPLQMSESERGCISWHVVCASCMETRPLPTTRESASRILR